MVVGLLRKRGRISGKAIVSGANRIERACFSGALVTFSRVPSSAQSWGYVASRNISKVSGSCLSAMNFAKKLVLALFTRNSGRHCRSALATTNSDGGMPGRMVRSQDPKELQTSEGNTAARY